MHGKELKGRNKISSARETKQWVESRRREKGSSKGDYWEFAQPGKQKENCETQGAAGETGAQIITSQPAHTTTLRRAVRLHP